MARELVHEGAGEIEDLVGRVVVVAAEDIHEAVEVVEIRRGGGAGRGIGIEVGAGGILLHFGEPGADGGGRGKEVAAADVGEERAAGPGGGEAREEAHGRTAGQEATGAEESGMAAPEELEDIAEEGLAAGEEGIASGDQLEAVALGEGDLRDEEAHALGTEGNHERGGDAEVGEETPALLGATGGEEGGVYRHGQGARRAPVEDEVEKFKGSEMKSPRRGEADGASKAEGRNAGRR